MSPLKNKWNKNFGILRVKNSRYYVWKNSGIII